MATQQSHITFSAALSLMYAVAGVSLLGMSSEVIVLACAFIIFAGMLPNIDAGNEAPARELGGLLAAVAPLVLLEYFPAFKTGGLARIALIVICCYLITRVLIVRALQKFMVHRGMMHSIPAAVITFELTYLIFWDEPIGIRLFISFAALIGFLSHLFLDAYGNLDLVGKAMGKPAKKQAVLKLRAPGFKTTLALWTCMVVLGWLVAKDFYPLPEHPPRIVW